MEYYLAIKKNEILLFATPWMDLEGIMLNEISQTEKNRYRMITLVLWNLKPKEQQQQKLIYKNVHWAIVSNRKQPDIT